MPNINSKNLSVTDQENIPEDILTYIKDDAKHQFLVDYTSHLALINSGVKASVNIVKNHRNLPKEGDCNAVKLALSPDYADLQKLAITTILLFSENTLQKIKAINNDRSGHTQVKIIGTEERTEKAPKPSHQKPH